MNFDLRLSLFIFLGQIAGGHFYAAVDNKSSKTGKKSQFHLILILLINRAFKLSH